MYAVPAEEFSIEYVDPKVLCVSTHGRFTEDRYFTLSEPHCMLLMKADFECKLQLRRHCFMTRTTCCVVVLEYGDKHLFSRCDGIPPAGKSCSPEAELYGQSLSLVTLNLLSLPT